MTTGVSIEEGDREWRGTVVEVWVGTGLSRDCGIKLHNGKGQRRCVEEIYWYRMGDIGMFLLVLGKTQ